jgi:hypothetical protein
MIAPLFISPFNNGAKFGGGSPAYAINRMIIPDGVNDYGTVVPIDGVTFPTKFTFYAFIELANWPMTSGQRKGIWSTKITNSTGLWNFNMVYLNGTSSKFECNVNNDAGGVENGGSGVTMQNADYSSGDKFLVVVTYDQSIGAANQVTFNILRGVSTIDSNNLTLATNTPPTQFRTTYLFSDKLTSARYFNQDVGEMGWIKDEAFTTTQMQSLWNSGNAANVDNIITTGTKLFQYKFEDNLLDTTGNYNATAVNGLGVYGDW